MNRQREWARIDRKKLRYDRYYTTQFQKALDEQIQPIIDAFKYAFTTPQVEQAVSRITKDPIHKVFISLYNRVGADFMSDTAGSFKSSGIQLVTKKGSLVDDPEAFSFLWQAEVNNWVLINAGDRIVTITETSKKRALALIKQITDQAFNEGLGMIETAKLLETQFPKQWRLEKWRAQTIARTEVLTASNEGSMRGAKATGLPMAKTWLTRLDGRERNSHRAMNGTEIPINEPFIFDNAEMQKPGDMGAPAEEVVNCRCVLAYRVL